MSKILTKAEWKTLRKQHGMEKGDVKASVGEKLDAYHKAKNLKGKVDALKTIKSALVKYKSALVDEKTPGEKALMTEINKIIKIVDATGVTLADRLENQNDLDKVDLKGLLAGGMYGQAFKTFLNHRKAIENHEFFLIAKKKPKGKVMKKVYQLYLSPDGAKSINIDSGLRDIYNTQAEQEDWDNFDLKPAAMACFALMNDLVSSFKVLMKTAMEKD